MLASMSSTEYLHWARHFTQHGFSRSTRLFSMGQICAAIWNVNLKKGQHVSPADFYPAANQPAKAAQTSEQIQAMMSDDNLGLSFPAPEVSNT